MQTLVLKKHTIHLLATDALWQWVKKKPVTNSTLIAQQIKIEFYKKHQRPLQISTPSLAVEILGHMVAYQLLKLMQQYVTAQPFLDLIIRYRQNAYRIDCGEWDYDSNRWLWDFLQLTMPLLKLLFR